MFRQGKPRAFKHNLRLAVLLSFVAGSVNIAGVLAISTLTTNVTGHFAYFAEELMLGDYAMAITFIAYILVLFWCNDLWLSGRARVQKISGLVACAAYAPGDGDPCDAVCRV